jgi:hypothetical protein
MPLEPEALLNASLVDVFAVYLSYLLFPLSG